MDNNTTKNQEIKPEEQLGDHNWTWYFRNLLFRSLITTIVLTGLMLVLYATDKPWSWWYLLPAGLITVGIYGLLEMLHSGNQNETWYLKNLLFNILTTTVIMIGLMAFLYATDAPKLTINEDILGTDVREGKVLPIYAGDRDASTYPTVVDYYIKSDFNKPIGNVKFLVDVSALNAIEFRQYGGTYNPSEVLTFNSNSKDQIYNFHGYLLIRANQSLKLSKGETRFVTMNIYADWLDYRPKDLAESSSYWTSEPIETVTIKLYG